MIYFIDGKKFDTAAATLLYSDGTFSDEKEYYYKTQAGNYIRLGVSMWQGSHDVVRQIKEEQFVQNMIESCHPDRAVEALKLAGIDINMFESI